MFYLDKDELIDVARAVAAAREAYKKELLKRFGEDVTDQYPIDVTIRVMLPQDVEGDPRSRIQVEVLHFYQMEEGHVSDRRY